MIRIHAHDTDAEKRLAHARSLCVTDEAAHQQVLDERLAWMPDRDRIESALASVNGTATTHTITAWGEVRDLARTAEAECVSLLGSPRHARGARYSVVSGDSVSNDYAQKWRYRAATRVVMVRRVGDWYLVSAERVEIGQKGGGARLILTPQQDEIAVALLRRRYRVERAS